MTTERSVGLQQPGDTREQAFGVLFRTYFKGLHYYAYSILRDSHAAEEMVQAVFVKLYERADKTEIIDSVEAYLYRAVYNACLNYRKHERVKADYRAHVSRGEQGVDPIGEQMDYRILEARLHEVLHELPEQCRTIFLLRRFEGCHYREIADRLNISVKTVENQMGKALRVLREKLKVYLVLLIIILLTFL